MTNKHKPQKLFKTHRLEVDNENIRRVGYGKI